MAVHTNPDKLIVFQMVFNGHYTEGLRIIDHFGGLLVKIRERDPLWKVSVATSKAVLSHHTHPIDAIIDVDRVIVNVRGQTSLNDAEKTARIMGDAAECIYCLTVDECNLPKTRRIGCRFLFVAPSDNLEEADRWTVRGIRGSFPTFLTESTKQDHVEAQAIHIVEDTETGLRRRFAMYAIVTEQSPDEPFIGMKGDKGSGGVVVDIDSYIRPDDGSHLYKTSIHVQEQFLAAKKYALRIFEWLVKQQKQ